MQKWFITICILLSLPRALYAQGMYAERVSKYISQYKALAIAEQKRSGIPASVTLAQGLLETEAGASELVTGANNHFGIKCKSTWKGETFAHTDDAPNECFRKYKCSEDSYRDHSDYLKNTPRYAALFKLKPTDYKGWCTGLKKCGYATSPIYARKLIGIIENFQLQDYTYAALNDHTPVSPQPVKPQIPAQAPPATQPVIAAVRVARADTPVKNVVVAKEDTVEEAPVSIVTTPAHPQKKHEAPATDRKPAASADSNILLINGLRAVKGKKGDILLQYAMKYNIRYEKFLDMNDLPDAPLYTGMYLYLERKHTEGPQSQHIVKAGENLHLIAQNEGMQLKKLRDFNLLGEGEEPVPGDVLQLQGYAAIKPYVVKKTVVPGKGKNVAVAHEDFGDETLTIRQAKPDTVAAVVPVPQAKITETPTVAGNKEVQNTPNQAIPAEGHASVSATAASNPVVTSIDATPAANNNTPQATMANSSPDTATSKKATDITTLVAQANDVVASVTAKDTTAAVVNNTSFTEAPATPPAVTEAPKSVETAAPVVNKETTDNEQAARNADDPLAKLKARLDKVVYPGNTEKTAAPVAKPEVKKETPRTVVVDDASKYYMVKPSETAFSIAKRNGITIRQLREWNKTVDLEQINAGQRLKIRE